MRKTIAWTTHLPVLIRLMNKTSGPVLELGSGIFSTPYLHWACFADKRELVSYDNSPEFIGLMQQYANDYHKVIAVDDYADADIEKVWSLAFVDHDPAHRRGIDTMRLLDYATFVVVHDSDPRTQSTYGYDEAFKHAKYRWDFTDVKPNTTVLSNFLDLKEFHL